MLLLLLQIPSFSRKQGSLTTDSKESCLMMLFSLSVFRFWYISWLRSWRKWLTLGLVGLAGRPPVVPRPWVGVLDMESTQPLARSRQQLQQSRPMGERQSSSDILLTGWWKGKMSRCKKAGSGISVKDDRVGGVWKKDKKHKTVSNRVFPLALRDRQTAWVLSPFQGRRAKWQVEFLPEKCSHTGPLSLLLSLSSSACSSAAFSLLFGADAAAMCY